MLPRNSILVVDDDDLERRSICETLSREGYEAVGVENGVRAMLLIKSSLPPALILLDLLMPEKDGFTVIYELRCNSKLALIPIVVISGAGEQQALEHAGIAGYLPKPFNRDELLEVVARFARRAAPTRGVRI